MIKLKIKIVFLISFVMVQSICFSQTIYYSTTNVGLYDFLDEMATQQLIAINSVVKPYSRKFIAEKLHEIDLQDSLLNKRQRQELSFYLKDFNKELKLDKNFKKRLDAFYYKDSLFTFSANPIFGGALYTNKNGSMYQRWVGAEAFATIDNHWGFYANLRDYKENKPFSAPTYLENRVGFKYKGDHVASDYSDMRGGITYNWKWGTIGLVKEHFVWGNNYNGSNIFSGNTPSFAQVRMHLMPVKWFEFNYVHAWLVSNVNDSSRIYRSHNANIVPFRKKYLTTNMFTFHPKSNTSFSFGNSIIYSDDDYLGYTIPVFFYKSVAHTYRNVNEMVNAQLFFDASVRLFKHLHLYGTMYIDELSFGRMFDKNKQSNYFSYKGGFAVDNLILKNAKFIFEYTRTNPLAFQHNVITTTFESNRYNLGHYLRDNAEEFYTSIIIKPYSTLRLQGKFIYARKGKEYAGDRTGEALGQPFISTTEWKNRTVGFSASYQIINDLYLTAEMLNSIYSGNPKYIAPYFWGHQVTYVFRLNFGF